MRAQSNKQERAHQKKNYKLLLHKKFVNYEEIIEETNT